ncbi:hypothetical protein [Streptomyces sp. SS8]
MDRLELGKQLSSASEQAGQPQRSWFPLAALPGDMVAYCRAGLEAYRAGHRFALHWHRPGDSIAHDPAAPDRVVVLPAT